MGIFERVTFKNCGTAIQMDGAGPNTFIDTTFIDNDADVVAHDSGRRNSSIRGS